MGRGGGNIIGDITRTLDTTFGGGLGQSLGVVPDGRSDGPKGLPDNPLNKKPTDISDDQLRAQRSKYAGKGNAPIFLGLNSAMTPEQQRTSIATNAVSGEGSGIDPEALKYYRSIALGSLINDKGQFADYSSITPIEQQYLQRVGVQPYNNTTQSFLSALDRAISGG